MSTKKPITNPMLRSWVELNEAVMDSENEVMLQKLLKEELNGRKRAKFVTRIHSRINKLRADRERKELEGKLQ